MPIHQSSLLALQIKTSTVRLGRLDQRWNSQQATNSLQPHARPNRIGIYWNLKWMAQREGLSSVLDGRSFAFNQEEELMTCHQIQNLHPYWSYFHIFSVTQIVSIHTFSNENFPAFVTFVDDKISGSVDSRSKTFDDLRHATRCRRSQVSDLGCHIYIYISSHTKYVYI